MVKKKLLGSSIILIGIIMSACGKEVTDGSPRTVTPTEYAVSSAALTITPTEAAEHPTTLTDVGNNKGSDRDLLRYIRTLVMKNSEAGWALSADGSLISTKDSWKSLMQIYQFKGYNKESFYPSISYVADTLMVFLYSSESSGSIDIYKSTDEGVDWSISHISDPVIAQCVGGNIYSSFINAREGYLLCCGQPGAGLMPKYLFKTKDGGETYQEVADISYLSGYPTSMNFSESGRGFITCTYHGNDAAHLYCSEDQGRTWNSFKVNPPENISYEYANSYLPYFKGQEGYILLAYVNHESDYPQYLMFHTTDGGKTWNAAGNVALNSSQIMSAGFGDDRTFYIIDDSGRLMKKVKTGDEWK